MNKNILRKAKRMSDSKANYIIARRRYIDARRRYMDDEIESKASKVTSLIERVKGKLMAAKDDPRVQKLIKILKVIGVTLGGVGGGALAVYGGAKAGLKIAALAGIAKEGDGIVQMLKSDTVRGLIGGAVLNALSAIFGLTLTIASIAKSKTVMDSGNKVLPRNKKNARAKAQRKNRRDSLYLL